MDKGVVIDNVIDTTISHNTGSKRLDNVTLATQHGITVQIRYHSQINVCGTSYINDTQLEALMSNDTINVEHTLVKDSSQVP